MPFDLLIYTRSSNLVWLSNLTPGWSSWYCARACNTKSCDSSTTFFKNELIHARSNLTLLCDKKFKNCAMCAKSVFRSIFIAHSSKVWGSNWYTKLKQPRVLALYIASLTSECLSSIGTCAHRDIKYGDVAKYSWLVTRAFAINGHLSVMMR